MSKYTEEQKKVIKRDLFKKFEECVESLIDAESEYLTEGEERILARRKLLGSLIEIYGSWFKQGDCIPKVVQMGYQSDNFFVSKIVKRKDL